MDIQLEKADIIERLRQVNDKTLLNAIRSMLDYAVKKETADHLLEESINRGLVQSEIGEGRPHKTVMSELRNKYKK